MSSTCADVDLRRRRLAAPTTGRSNRAPRGLCHRRRRRVSQAGGCRPRCPPRSPSSPFEDRETGGEPIALRSSHRPGHHVSAARGVTEVLVKPASPARGRRAAERLDEAEARPRIGEVMALSAFRSLSVVAPRAPRDCVASRYGIQLCVMTAVSQARRRMWRGGGPSIYIDARSRRFLTEHFQNSQRRTTTWSPCQPAKTSGVCPWRTSAPHRRMSARVNGCRGIAHASRWTSTWVTGTSPFSTRRCTPTESTTSTRTCTPACPRGSGRTPRSTGV